MSKRVSFNITNEVNNKLSAMLNSSGVNVNDAIKAMLYNMTDCELEETAEQRAKLEAVRERRALLAEKERKLSQSRGKPENPFAVKSKVSDSKSNEGSGHKKSPFVKR